MYTKLVDGLIIFYYDRAKLFDDVQHLSAFMCKNIASKDGEDLSERYAITDDEKGMFDICLRETLPAVYEALRILTYGIPAAFTDSMTGTQIKAAYSVLANVTTIVDADAYVVLRVNNHEAYNPNDVALVDSALLSALEQGAVMQFYSRVLQNELTQLSAGQFQGQMENVARRIVPLQKKSKF